MGSAVTGLPEPARPWGRDIEERIRQLEGGYQRAAVAEKAIQKKVDATSFTVGDSVAAIESVGEEVADTRRIPKPPQNLTVNASGIWDTLGQPVSYVELSWDAVTHSVDIYPPQEEDAPEYVYDEFGDLVEYPDPDPIPGEPIDIAQYEVWAIDDNAIEYFRVSATEETTYTHTIPVAASYSFVVRARSVAGRYGAFSESQPVVGPAPTGELSGPVLSDLYTDGVGTIYAVWGGLIGVDISPAWLAYVVAEVSSDGGESYTTMGTPLVAAGAIVINPGAYGEYYVRLRGYDRLGNAGDASDPQIIETTDPHFDPPSPMPPTNLVSTPGAAWDSSGISPVAWFDLEWTAPTLDVDGNETNIIGYDIWGSEVGQPLRFLASSTAANIRWYVGIGSEWSFQVAATGEFGGVSEFGGAVSDIADATIPVTPAPAAPTLDQYAGLLRIRWSGNGMQPHIKYAYAAISTDGAGPYTRAGMPLTGAGEVVVPGLATGEEYFAKIVMVDELGQLSASVASDGLVLDPITGITVQTSPLANTGIKMTDAALTAYDESGDPTFVVDAETGQVWIAPYDAVFHFGADGVEAETGDPTTGLAITGESISFNTFFHPAGVQIRNDQTPLSWWEGDALDASLVNFFSPRVVIEQRMRLGDYEFLREEKSTGSRLVMRYRGEE